MSKGIKETNFEKCSKFFRKKPKDVQVIHNNINETLIPSYSDSINSIVPSKNKAISYFENHSIKEEKESECDSTDRKKRNSFFEIEISKSDTTGKKKRNSFFKMNQSKSDSDLYTKIFKKKNVKHVHFESEKRTVEEIRRDNWSRSMSILTPEEIKKYSKFK